MILYSVYFTRVPYTSFNKNNISEILHQFSFIRIRPSLLAGRCQAEQAISDLLRLSPARVNSLGKMRAWQNFIILACAFSKLEVKQIFEVVASFPLFL